MFAIFDVYGGLVFVSFFVLTIQSVNQWEHETFIEMERGFENLYCRRHLAAEANMQMAYRFLNQSQESEEGPPYFPLTLEMKQICQDLYGNLELHQERNLSIDVGVPNIRARWRLDP